MNILLVEDEVSLSEALVHILKKENMDLSQILLLLYDGDDNYNLTKKEII